MPDLKSPLLLFIALLFFMGTSVLASSPSRPSDVPDNAAYHSGGQVWVLDESGQRTVWYSNGTKKAEGPYSNGKREGSWTFWFASGDIHGQGSFRSDLKHGQWKFYVDRDDDRPAYLKSEGAFMNNLREGAWTFYYPDRKVETKGTYQRGQKHGEWENYYASGRIFYRGRYQNDEAHGSWEYFYRNGHPYQSGQYAEGTRVGSWKICVAPGGPCGQETFRTSGAPRFSGLSAGESFGGPNNTSDPSAVLDALDNGGVPDETPSGVRNDGW